MAFSKEVEAFIKEFVQEIGKRTVSLLFLLVRECQKELAMLTGQELLRDIS